MQVRTVRIRPVRTDTLNQHGIARRDNQGEVSFIGEAVAIVEFGPEGQVGHVDWLRAMPPKAKQAVITLCRSYADTLITINGGK